MGRSKGRELAKGVGQKAFRDHLGGASLAGVLGLPRYSQVLPLDFAR